MIYYLNIVVCICVNAVCASACYVLCRSRRQLYRIPFLLHGLHEIWKSKKKYCCYKLILFVGDDVALLVQCLPGAHEALCLFPSSTQTGHGYVSLLS